MKTPAALNEAIAQFLRHRASALTLARQASREAPEAAAAHLFEACLLLCSRDRRDFDAAAQPLARALALEKTAREKRHEAAVIAAAGGDYARACGIFDAALADDPRDLVALGVAHVFDYFLGNPASIRGRSARALARWDAGEPGYHAVLSMHAFALQECGEYAAAEDTARRAAALEPRDLRAWHAVTHVLEMQGRADEGLRWLDQGERAWDGEGGASTHLWWHRALLHLQQGDVAAALALHDERIGGENLSTMIDASALLWRLKVMGVEVGDRFIRLASLWEPHAEDAHCAFNDTHAMMAFAGARRWDLAARLLRALDRRLSSPDRGANYDMTRLVGVPACRAPSKPWRGRRRRRGAGDAGPHRCW
ncbi:MAG TPA: tetratricopeptide repeat protein [Burkholderiales bacterium]|nr:tetratricopeptide repeat protein [Burkholderiales bacterium]